MLARNWRGLSKCRRLEVSIRALLHWTPWMRRDVSHGLASSSGPEGFGPGRRSMD